MIKIFNEKWFAHKDKLKEKLLTLHCKDVDSYEKLLKLIIDNIFNVDEEDSWDKVSSDEIKTIDFGDYQGTLIFVYHMNHYQPSATNTFYTSTYYGSCSCCDTLLSIIQYDYEKELNESQVIELMNLCLHMIQNTYRFKEYDLE